MKRALCILMAMVILVISAACEESEKTIEIKPIDFKELQQKYLLYSTILAHSWDNAEELRPDLFPNYYAIYFISDGGEFVPDEKKTIYIPQEDVETMVQSHFDVSVDFLRSGISYKPEQQAYAFYGIASSLYTQITSAQKTGKARTINYDMLDITEKLVAQGTIAMEVDGKNYKYISNEVTWLEE